MNAAHTVTSSIPSPPIPFESNDSLLQKRIACSLDWERIYRLFPSGALNICDLIPSVAQMSMLTSDGDVLSTLERAFLLDKRCGRSLFA